MPDEGKSEAEGRTGDTAAAPWPRGEDGGRDCPEAAEDTQQSCWGEVKRGKIFCSPPCENKCEAGFPDHRCLPGTNSGSQTKDSGELYVTAEMLVVPASRHKLWPFKLQKYSTQFHIWKEKNVKNLLS